MEKRHSTTPTSRTTSPRPGTSRKRSNSLPIVEALGCSTPEAELILAEGRAAVRSRSRHASARRHGRRRHRSDNDKTAVFRPQEHLQYLDDHVVVEDTDYELPLDEIMSSSHNRILSTGTDDSVSTITGPVAPLVLAPPSPSASPTSPLDDYSANLAKFIKTQLNSIPTYHNMVCPRSCPDLVANARTPPLSPMKLDRGPNDMPKALQMPPVRPPLRSAFSEWSSTDDETDDDAPPVPSAGLPKKNYTPSILRYYENSAGGSFLFSSTPSEVQEEEIERHPNVDGFRFPNAPETNLPEESSSEHEPADRMQEDYPSSALSSRPLLSSSSAPSFSSASTASYFECKRPISFAPDVRDRIIAAVSPKTSNGKVLTAISPYEGGALTSVHDILMESDHRVLVDGLSFDLIQNFNIPHGGMETAPRVQTPC